MKLHFTERNENGEACRFAGSLDWSFDNTDSGERTVSKVWDINHYDGIQSGDSGGPLLRDADISSGRLCGIMSRSFLDVASLCTDCGNDAASVDSDNNKAWLSAYLVDSKTGGIVGDCPPGTPAVDTDGDGWYDLCDNCPYVDNTRQEDRDGDFVGDLCDNCVNNKNPGQADRNLLAEIDAFGLPACGAVDPRPPFSGEPTEACWHVEPPSLTYLTEKYPGDLCDGNPITAPVQVEPGLSRYHDDSGRSLSCKIFPGTYCSPHAPIDGACPVERGNVFHATEFVGGGVGEQLGLSRALACQCPSGVDLLSCAKLLSYNCRRSDVVGGGSPRWKTMTLAPLTPPSVVGTLNLAPGLIASVHPDLLTSTAHQQDWGWRYWRDISDLPPPSVGTSLAFDGLVWTWVQSFNQVAEGSPPVGTPVTGSGTNIIRRQYVTRAVVTEEGVDAVIKDCTDATYSGYSPFPGLVSDPLWVIGADTPIRPPMPGDPPPGIIVAAPSFPAESITSSLPADVIATIRGTTGFKIIPAYDTPENWKGIRSGVLFDPATGHIVSLLGVAGGSVFSEPLLQDPPPPFVIAVSGHRQEVSIFGLRDSSGKILDLISTFDFDLRTPKRQKILSQQKLVEPVAVTYRAEDDAYYLLDKATDKKGHPSMRLVLATRGGTIEQLRECRLHRDWEHFDMTTGNDGAIVLSAWSSKRHAVAEIGFATNLLAYLRRLTFGSDSLVLPALARFEGVYLVRNHDGRQVLERLPNVVKDSIGSDHDDADNHDDHGDGDHGGGDHGDHGDDDDGALHDLCSRFF